MDVPSRGRLVLDHLRFARGKEIASVPACSNSAEMAGHLGSARVKQQSYWHVLPVGWEQLDYQTFLDRRRPLLAKVVRDGFEKLWDDAARRRATSSAAGRQRSGAWGPCRPRLHHLLSPDLGSGLPEHQGSDRNPRYIESKRSRVFAADHTNGRWMSGRAMLPCLMSSMRWVSE